MATEIINTIIIGGGLSGLFCADKLIERQDNDFLLIETTTKNLGGFSLWGDMKIGMPPAGTKTS